MSGLTPTRVVLVGGGYVTLHAYATLLRRVRREVRHGRIEIVVISPDHSHRFHGFTGELLAGMIAPSRVATPLVDILPRARIIRGSVVRIDRAARTVAHTDDDAGTTHVLAFDHLVLGTGSREPLSSVEGLAAHGTALRNPGEITALAQRLAADPTSPAVVIGGGIAGAELATAIADRGNPVTLVHGHDTIAAEWAGHPRLLAHTHRQLAAAGVDVRTGVRASRVTGSAVELSDGTLLPCRHVVATLGERPVEIPGLDDLRDATGRLSTRDDLSVADGIWAAGDAADVAHPVTGAPIPANALWAIKGGDHIGRAIGRALSGRQPRRFGYRGLGRAAAFGRGRAISELYGIGFTGGLAWMLRLTFFLRFMPSRRRALGVVGDLMRRPRHASRSVTAPSPAPAAVAAA